MGVWTKVKDHWVYDGEMNRLIRLDKGTSYEQLIEEYVLQGKHGWIQSGYMGECRVDT